MFIHSLEIRATLFGIFLYTIQGKQRKESKFSSSSKNCFSFSIPTKFGISRTDVHIAFMSANFELQNPLVVMYEYHLSESSEQTLSFNFSRYVSRYVFKILSETLTLSSLLKQLVLITSKLYFSSLFTRNLLAVRVKVKYNHKIVQKKEMRRSEG